MNEKWTRDEEGEYNEQTATIMIPNLPNRRMLVEIQVKLYSDRDGERWTAAIDNGDPVDLDATDEYRAREEAIRLAMEA